MMRCDDDYGLPDDGPDYDSDDRDGGCPDCGGEVVDEECPDCGVHVDQCRCSDPCCPCTGQKVGVP
ncbi:MAG: hypothetical protein ABII82_20950 [Verrucomicrobiota bacterium]